jgi:hypothetical protein
MTVTSSNSFSSLLSSSSLSSSFRKLSSTLPPSSSSSASFPPQNRFSVGQLTFILNSTEECLFQQDDELREQRRQQVSELMIANEKTIFSVGAALPAPIPFHKKGMLVLILDSTTLMMKRLNLLR